MLLRVWRFITLVLAALTLTMESAHVLELPQKMMRLRARWEYGHVAGFILTTSGFLRASAVRVGGYAEGSAPDDDRIPGGPSANRIHKLNYFL